MPMFKRDSNAGVNRYSLENPSPRGERVSNAYSDLPKLKPPVRSLHASVPCPAPSRVLHETPLIHHQRALSQIIAPPLLRFSELIGPHGSVLNEKFAPLTTSQPERLAPLTPSQPEMYAPLTPSQPERYAPLTPSQPKMYAPLTPSQPEMYAPLTTSQPERNEPLTPSQPERIAPPINSQPVAVTITQLPKGRAPPIQPRSERIAPAVHLPSKRNAVPVSVHLKRAPPPEPILVESSANVVPPLAPNVSQPVPIHLKRAPPPVPILIESSANVVPPLPPRAPRSILSNFKRTPPTIPNVYESLAPPVLSLPATEPLPLPMRIPPPVLIPPETIAVKFAVQLDPIPWFTVSPVITIPRVVSQQPVRLVQPRTWIADEARVQPIYSISLDGPQGQQAKLPYTISHDDKIWERAKRNESRHVQDSILCEVCGRCRCVQCREPTSPTCLKLCNKDCIEYCSCVYFMRGIVDCYKPTEDIDETAKVCSHLSRERVRKCLAFGLASFCVPCLCCYWPLTACHQKGSYSIGCSCRK